MLSSNNQQSFSENYKKGISYFQAGKYEEAIEFFHKEINMQPSQIELWNMMATSLAYLARYREAIKYFEESIEKYQFYYKSSNANKIKANYDITLSDIWYKKGVCHYNLDPPEYIHAVDCLDKAIKLDPISSCKWFHKGYALGGQKNFEQAIHCCNEAIKLDPHFSDAFRLKGFMYHKLSNYKEAIECCNEATKLKPSEYTWNTIGYMMLLNYKEKK